MMNHNSDAGRHCAICNQETSLTCRNCRSSHGSPHLHDGVCAGCQGQLWTIERRIVQGTATIYGVLALVGIFVVQYFTSNWVTAWLGSTGLFLVPLLLGYFSIPHIVRPLVRRALRNKYFAPTSERFVAKIAGPAPKDPRTAYEAAYQSRGKPKGRRGPKRLRALGRNGFYYDR